MTTCNQLDLRRVVTNYVQKKSSDIARLPVRGEWMMNPRVEIMDNIMFLCDKL